MRFSIITVTKNNKAGLLRAIECLRNQTYKNVEHIIVDGGSTDGTREMMDDALRQAQGDKLLTTHYSLLTISEPDEGIYDAINKGIKLAMGDVIGLLHSDDLYAAENVLEKYAEVFNLKAEGKEQSAVEVVYSDLVYVEAVNSEQKSVNSKITDHKSLITDHSILRYWKTHKSVSSNQSSVNGKNTDHYLLVTDHLLKKGWMPPHPTLFIRKGIFDKYGLYNTELKIASDYEMILRLFYKHKINSCYLQHTTYLMTIGGASNKNLRSIMKKSKEDYLAMKMHNIPSPIFTLISKNLRKLPQFLARSL